MSTLLLQLLFYFLNNGLKCVHTEENKNSFKEEQPRAILDF